MTFLVYILSIAHQVLNMKRARQTFLFFSLLFSSFPANSASHEHLPIADKSIQQNSQPPLTVEAGNINPSSSSSDQADFNRQTSFGRELATNLAAVTGIAIAPLFGISAVSCYVYYDTSASERHELPWYNSPLFWGTGFCLWLLFISNTQLGMAVPLLKKPMDTVEIFENKISAIISQPALLSQFYAFGTGLVSIGAANNVASAAHSPLLASVGITGVFFGICMAIAGLFAFAVVWLVSHTIHVFILLSPWGGIDNALRLIKGTLLAVIVGSLYVPVIGPYLCIAICLIIITISCFIAAWAFRLMVFGSTCAWDLLTFRHRRFKPESSPIRAFVLQPLDDTPKRTYGSIRRDKTDNLIFAYRNWLILPEKTVQVEDGELYAEEGIFSPTLDRLDPETDKSPSLFRFPPRYRGHEKYLVDSLALKGILDEPIFKGFRNAWRWLKHRIGMDVETPKSASS
jgi:hypothetical protein